MSRRLPRSFFWIDQQVVRSGIWGALSCVARLAYVALSASVDREGVSIWSKAKLMELAACQDPDEWSRALNELESRRLIESVSENVPPAIRLLNLEPISEQRDSALSAGKGIPPPSTAPIIVHTHTIVRVGGEAAHAEPGNTN
jgi:hypothetical protein